MTLSERLAAAWICALLSCAPWGRLAASPGEPATSPPLLPAWETPEERAAAAKADEHDDFREAHPELYGVTAPPSQPVRSFAEFEPAQALLMRPGGGIGPFHRGILEGARGHVPLVVVFHETGQAGGLEGDLGNLGFEPAEYQLLDVGDTDAIWTRDYGPIAHLTSDGAVGLADFRYYQSRHRDDSIPTKLAASWGVPVFRPSLSYEGGNFMADAEGTCYATEKIHQQNAGHGAAEVDRWMREYAGCRQVVTLLWPEGLGTGHIDMFAKLMDASTVVLGEYDPAVRPENAALLDQNAELLEAVTPEGGGGLEVLRIPLPWDDTEVWYTYTNSLILNDVLLVPVYTGFEDLEAEALAVYEAAAPHLAIHTVTADSIIPSGGSIHCVTMTVPEGRLEMYQDPPVQLCPFNELKRCDAPLPCWGLPLEGACDGGDLLFCGADGYPHAAACPGCCGWDAAALDGQGWFDCLGPGACDCGEGCGGADAGCSALGTHAWACGEADGGGCNERVFTACGLDASCDPGTGTCTGPSTPPPDEDCVHDCDLPGARFCDGATVRTCMVDPDGCRVVMDVRVCTDAGECRDGRCVEATDEPVEDTVSDTGEAGDVATEPARRGNGCAASGGAATGPWLLLLLSGFLLRRRMSTWGHGPACVRAPVLHSDESDPI